MPDTFLFPFACIAVITFGLAFLLACVIERRATTRYARPRKPVIVRERVYPHVNARAIARRRDPYLTSLRVGVALIAPLVALLVFALLAMLASGTIPVLPALA